MSHLPDAAAQATEEARLAKEIADRADNMKKHRDASLKTMRELGKSHAKGTVALMKATLEYATAVREGWANVDGDAEVWYVAFAKASNEVDHMGVELIDTKDVSSPVSNFRTFVHSDVLLMTKLVPTLYADVLAVRKDVEPEDRVSTYQSLIRVNRAIKNWIRPADEDGNDMRTVDMLIDALSDAQRKDTLFGWLAPDAKSPAKGLKDKLDAIATAMHKLAKKENSDALREQAVAFSAFSVDLLASIQARNTARDELITAEQAKVAALLAA